MEEQPSSFLWTIENNCNTVQNINKQIPKDTGEQPKEDTGREPTIGGKTFSFFIAIYLSTDPNPC